MTMIQKAAANRSASPLPAETAKKKPVTLKEYVQSMSKQIAVALPSNITPERFSRIVLTAISTNPKLQECTPQSFLGAMMTAAQMGIEPNTPLGLGYLLPRKSKSGAMECTFQLGYKGMIDLAFRSGNIASIGAYAVHAGDTFEVRLGTDPYINHIPTLKDKGDVIAYYAYYKTKDGHTSFEVMTVDEVREHARKFSDAVKRGWSSPWDTNPDEMAKKTVLKKVLKYAPLTAEASSKIAMDESVHHTISSDMASEPISYEIPDADPETGEITEEGGGKT